MTDLFFQVPGPVRESRRIIQHTPRRKRQGLPEYGKCPFPVPGKDGWTPLDAGLKHLTSL